MAVKVLIVDDHPVFLAGLNAMIHKAEDISVIAEAKDGKEAMEMVKKHAPEIVVMDITMPNLSGIEATHQILAHSPKTKVLALSIHSGKRFVKDMLDAGASGYLLKDSAPDELITAIQKIARGEMYLSSNITSIALGKDDEEEGPKDSQILYTKLHRPPVMNDHIVRKNIIDQLESNIDKPLSLISAPAGYGKSVVVSQWLEQTSILYAWISLDKEFNNLRVFLSYFHAAIEILFPGSLIKTYNLINSPELPPSNILSTTLLKELDKIQHDFILVLDDYHRIEEESIHLILDELIHFPPEHMHLCIITRRDPPFRLQSLRSSNRMTEIRMTELTFNDQEIISLYRNINNVSLTDETAKSLQEKTEGWITGLRLASLSIDNTEDIERILDNLSVGLHSVSEYLLEEVLTNQPLHLMNLLLMSSVLDRFNARLLDEINPKGDLNKDERISGHEFIEWLIKSDLFIISLDDTGQWFRYHHLFQNLLQNRLNQQFASSEIQSIHARASKWFHLNDYLNESIQHGLASGDLSGTAQKVEHYGHDLINEERIVELDYILDQLPDDIIKQRPMLLIFDAWLARVKVQIPKIKELLDQAEILLNNEPPSVEMHNCLWGYLNCIRSYERYAMMDTETTLDCTQKAIELLPHKYSYILGFAYVVRTAALQMTNRFQEALSLLNSALSEPGLQASYTQGIMLHSLAKICMMQAAYHSQCSVAKTLLSLSKHRGMIFFQCWAEFNLACSYYHLNEVSQSKETLGCFIKHRYQIYPDAVSDSVAIFILSCMALDEIQEAQNMVNLLDDYAQEKGNARLQLISNALRAEIALREGNLTEAIAWSETFNPRQLYAYYFFYLPELTYVKVLLAKDSTESRQQAKILLSSLEEFSRKTNNNSILIPVLTLWVVLLSKEKEQSSALERINEAISIAYPGGGIRAFIEAGKPVIRLLQEFPEEISQKDFAHQIIQAYDQKKVIQSPDHSLTTHPENNRQGEDQLSLRELEILSVLAEGLRNKEIAAKLFVGEETIKKHLYNIFQKLNVKSRIELVKKAKELKLID